MEAPSVARDGSTPRRLPAENGGLGRKSPRSARRSRRGRRRPARSQVDDRRLREALVAGPLRRLLERHVDLHAGAAVVGTGGRARQRRSRPAYRRGGARIAGSASRLAITASVAIVSPPATTPVACPRARRSARRHGRSRSRRPRRDDAGERLASFTQPPAPATASPRARCDGNHRVMKPDEAASGPPTPVVQHPGREEPCPGRV